MFKKMAVIWALVSSTAAFALGENTVSGSLGFSPGSKITLGAEFEHALERSVGVGGFLRIIQKYEAKGDGGASAPGIFVLAGNVRLHYPQKSWDFSVAPGFGLLNIDTPLNTEDDTTTLGPTLALAAMYQLNSKISLGVEHSSYYVWLDKAWSSFGPYTDMTAKLTASF